MEESSIHGVDVTMEELQTLKHWFIGLNLFSAIAAAVTTVTNLVSRKKRAFPSRLTTAFAASAFGFHVSLLLSWAGGFPSLHMRPSEIPARWSSCDVQGALFSYFAFAVMCWWGCISLNLYRVVHQDVTVQAAKSYELGYNVVGWGAPLLQTIVLFWRHDFGAEVGALYCWISVKDHGKLKIYAFYLFLAFFSTVGVYWGVRIMRKLYAFHQRRVQIARAARARASRTVSRTPTTSHSHTDVALTDDSQDSRAALRRYPSSAPGTPHGEANSAAADPATSYFAYYIWRQALFMFVMLARFTVFGAWQINYMLFQSGKASITFPLCFIINYFVGSIGLDAFILICLTRDNIARLKSGWRRLGKLFAADSWQSTSGEASRLLEDNSTTSAAESEQSTRGLAAMTPERPKRHALNV